MAQLCLALVMPLPEELNIKKLAIVLLSLSLSCVDIVQAAQLEYFVPAEFADRITGEKNMDPSFLLKLDELRRLCGFPLRINSGYRSRDHPVEKIKSKPGTHNKGIAVDIRALTPSKRNMILKYAVALGFTGIGVYPLHIHLDMRKSKTVIWVKDKYPDKRPRHTPTQ